MVRDDGTSARLQLHLLRCFEWMANGWRRFLDEYGSCCSSARRMQTFTLTIFQRPHRAPSDEVFATAVMGGVCALLQHQRVRPAHRVSCSVDCRGLRSRPGFALGARRRRDASSVSAVAEDGGSSGLDTPAVVPVTSCRWEVQACLSFLEAGRGSTANSKKSGCSGCVQQYKLWDLDDYLVLSTVLN